MKYSRKYPAVSQGRHAPDERLYRAHAARPCAHCGAMTEWFDLTLDIPICSDECQRERTSRPKAPPAGPPPLVGQLLLTEGLITEAQLAQALRLQQRLDTYTPIGQVLVDQTVITLKQLNALLDRYRKRPKLGGVLIAAKVIMKSQLDQAVLSQRGRRLRLGDVLIRLGFATERQIKQAICIQLNLPFIDLKAFKLADNPESFKLADNPELAKLFKRLYAVRYQVVPIAKLGNTLTVAMDDPTNLDVIRTVQACTGLMVNVVLGTRAGLEHAIDQVYG
jgi:Type II secretion system (T2SS), protein E, N-terminal domain